MNFQECCPRCRLIVPAERMVEIPPVCPHCGWILSNSEGQAGRYLNSRFRQAAILMSLAIVVAFVHLVTWDSYFVEVIPLKTRQILSIASAADRKNPDCSESALTAAVDHSPNELPLQFQLGKIRYQMGNYAGSVEVFDKYFAQGGRNLEAAFTFAKSLEEVQRQEDAAQYYEFILGQKTETLQITVTQNYVRLLKTMGQYKRAIALIESIRKRGSNAAYFLDSELQDLKRRARSRRRSS